MRQPPPTPTPTAIPTVLAELDDRLGEKAQFVPEYPIAHEQEYDP